MLVVEVLKNRDFGQKFKKNLDFGRNLQKNLLVRFWEKLDSGLDFGKKSWVWSKY